MTLLRIGADVYVSGVARGVPRRGAVGREESALCVALRRAVSRLACQADSASRRGASVVIGCAMADPSTRFDTPTICNALELVVPSDAAAAT